MNESPRRRRPTLRSVLRSLLVAAVVAAILLTLAARWIWPLRREHLLARLGIALGLITLTVLIGMVDLRRQRRLAQSNGRLLMRLSNGRSAWIHVVYWLLALVTAWAAYQTLLVWVVTAQPPGALTLIVLCGPLAFFELRQLRPILRPAEARESGLVLSDGSALPWAKIESHYWGGIGPSHLTLQLHREVVNLQVTPKDKEPFDKLLHEMESRHASYQQPGVAQRPEDRQ